jgi:DnaJ family protein C protein 7
MDLEAMECDTTSPELDPQLAEKYKLEGNQAYGQKDYPKAFEAYSLAIKHNPFQASYYGNRSAALMMLNHYGQALDDARHCITLDDTFVKGYLRAAKCYMMVGNPSLSIDYYDKALSLQPHNTQAVDEKSQCQVLISNIEKSQQLFDKGDFRACVHYLDRCLNIVPFCEKFRTFKAEALAMNGNIDEATSLSNDLIRVNNNNSDAIYIKALCLYFQDDTSRAHQFLQRVLRNDPDHKKALKLIKISKQLIRKKEEGNEAFKNGNPQEACDLYTQALAIDPYNSITNSKLYCNRALMLQKLGRLQEAIDDCTEAIKLDDKYIRAYKRRAGLYSENEQYEESLRDWKKVFDLEPNRENKQLVNEAEKQLKLSKRKDYYKILGVDKSATQDELKRGYRKKALLHHPGGMGVVQGCGLWYWRRSSLVS